MNALLLSGGLVGWLGVGGGKFVVQPVQDVLHECGDGGLAWRSNRLAVLAGDGELDDGGIIGAGACPLAAVELGAQQVLLGKPPRPAGVEHLVFEGAVLACPGQLAGQARQQRAAWNRREHLPRWGSGEGMAVVAADRKCKTCKSII